MGNRKEKKKKDDLKVKEGLLLGKGKGPGARGREGRIGEDKRKTGPDGGMICACMEMS